MPSVFGVRLRRIRRATRALSVIVVLAVGGYGAWALVSDLGIVDDVHDPVAEHGDQNLLCELVQDGETHEAFETAFETGDELFEDEFNALDGVGANVGRGQRFTRVPRADLTGPGEWKHHVPARATGPNGSSCTSCHSKPFDDGAGDVNSDVHRDPFHTGNLASMIHRNTPHIFGLGALQRLAEEMTAELKGIVAGAEAAACASGGPVTVALRSKGVSFGSVTVRRTSTDPCVTSVDTTDVSGVSADLVVRPFQWKGSVATIRDFVRGAFHNELGMQAVEMCGDGVDGDYDGVVDELTIGDITSVAVYAAAQPRPVSKLELHQLGLEPMAGADRDTVRRGGRLFLQVGCAVCHVPTMTLDDPVFREPSAMAEFRDATFPAGQDPLALCVDPAKPVSFDLTQDQPDNVVTDDEGTVVKRLGSLMVGADGKARVRLFGDLKRHDMGPGLAESIDETGSGASVFLTENLWGVASTAPYLHDGRASTLTEAILEHGGEAAAARAAFVGLETAEKKDLVAFLESLVLFRLPEE